MSPPAVEAGARPPRLAVRVLHLSVLGALAVAQPLFELLGDNAEFFAARRSPGADIVVWALGLLVLPPLVGLAVEAAAGAVDRRLGWGVHLALVGILAALLGV